MSAVQIIWSAPSSVACNPIPAGAAPSSCRPLLPASSCTAFPDFADFADFASSSGRSGVPLGSPWRRPIRSGASARREQCAASGHEVACGVSCRPADRLPTTVAWTRLDETLTRPCDNDRILSAGRRHLMLGLAPVCILLLDLRSAPASAEELQPPAPPASTAAAKPGLIERLLERTKENKAKYDQQRLDDYYRRNYRDYFEFMKGSLERKDKDKLTEAEQGILQWLEKNK